MTRNNKALESAKRYFKSKGINVDSCNPSTLLRRHSEILKACAVFEGALRFIGVEVVDEKDEETGFSDTFALVHAIETVERDGKIVDVKFADRVRKLDVYGQNIEIFMGDPLNEFAYENWNVVAAAYKARLDSYVPSKKSLQKLFELGYAAFAPDSDEGRLSLSLGDLNAEKRQLRKEAGMLATLAREGDDDYYRFCPLAPSDERSREREESRGNRPVFDDTARLQSAVFGAISYLSKGNLSREEKITWNWRVNRLSHEELRTAASTLDDNFKIVCKAFRSALARGQLSFGEFFELTGVTALEYEEYISGQLWAIDNISEIASNEAFVADISLLSKRFAFDCAEQLKSERKAQHDAAVAESDAAFAEFFASFKA